MWKHVHFSLLQNNILLYVYISHFYTGKGDGNPLQHSCLENPHRQRILVRYSPWGRKELDATEQLSTAHITFLIHSLTKELWGSLYLLAIIKITSAVNICVQVFMWIHGFTSTGHILRNRIAFFKKFYILSFEELLGCFLKWVHHFTCLPVVHEDSSFPTF